ncbi:helicase-related protein [uncultured Ferrimonas sp.]|uniref:helicase-related protein n=1 Tax=uncultured Ferrimonas sp. TaxID=432640 RepID=UPI00260684E0|nr:helicase-related protein [uncultured Ferrimonas sp.]
MSVALPIDPLKTEFLSALSQHHLVVEAPTGSGKSTRLPLWAAEQGRVLVVEPRRIACTALAQFVGQGRDDIGYAIRFDNSVTDASQVAFVTPGVALRWYSEDKLAGFRTIIIDEFHERRWDTDLLLALLKRGNEHRLVLTSATVDGERLAQFLAAQRLQADGRTFAVSISYHSSDSYALPNDQQLLSRLKRCLETALANHSDRGDILVFLPGRKEISQAQASLAAQWPELLVLPLHASVSKAEQQLALQAQPQRRIVLATNVAETSLTIPGVTLVIDTGLERRTSQRNGRTVLGLTRISAASAAQRAGRAGRVAPGRCIRLWGQHAPLEALTPPELQREELVEPMLAAASAGAVLAQLPFVDPLPAKSLHLAQQRLQQMGAIDDNGAITPHGQALFPLPIDTQFAHLISAMPDRGCQEAMVDLAAALSIGQRLWQAPTSDVGWQALQQWQPLPCDGVTLVQLLRQTPPPALNVDAHARAEARQMANQIRAALALPQLQAASYLDREPWLQAMLAAMPELAFVRRAKRREALGNGSIEVQPSRESRFSDDAEAALVLDQFALPGRGVRQTLILATCMMPIGLARLCQADLGQEQLSPRRADEQGQRLHERLYAGRVIGTDWRRPAGELGFELMVEQILTDKLLAPAGSVLANDARAWALYLGLGEAQGEPIDVTAWLTAKLQQLGVESRDDLALIEVADLKFEGVPQWQREELAQGFPHQLALPDLNLNVEYAPRGKVVTLVYASGRRKGEPKRWELPSWQGWRIRYRKASRVVEVR